MSLVNTIRTFIEALDLSGEVLGVSNDGTESTLLLENSFNLREKRSIFIDEVEYIAKQVDSDQNTVVVSGVIASADKYRINTPNFFHGTHYIINIELSREEDSDSLPAFLMLRTNKRVQNEESEYDSIASFSFLLVDNANYGDWRADNYVDYRLEGLNKLADAIISHARNYKQFGRIDSEITVDEDYKLGEIKDRKGAINSLFDKRLTGLMMRMTIPIRKQCKC